MMKTLNITLILIFFMLTASAQEKNIPVADNLVTENIPPLPVSYVSDVKNYTEARSATLAAWHPTRKEMIISTRFGNSNQLHYVKMPGGARSQMTFFDEPISSASFEPLKGEYFIFSKDRGGDEFSQLYRYDLASREITLLTDGKRSQNGGIEWNNKRDLIAYTSTRRNGKDRDVFVMNPKNPSSDKNVAQHEGGGWSIADWTPDDSKLLLREGISVNESRIYLFDLGTGFKTRILPENDERTTYGAIGFSPDGKGFYLITNKDNEFNRLAYYELASKKLTYITTAIPWDIENAELSEDGKRLAFVANENGLSKLYVLETANNKFKGITTLPTGVIGSLRWTNDSKVLGFTFVAYNSSADVFELNVETSQLTRWTESELGLMDASKLQEPKLITWNSFDQKQISGYLYKASPKFSGKRPVIIIIHGGPEGQARPNFIGRNNYYLNELGISLIYPNVRGSSGYGKTFLDLDNGIKREESVRDIGALIDWISRQPDLDANRIMVMGGSYGGYMTLAVSYLFSDRITCAVDIVGISNFNTFMKNTEAYRRDLRRVEYGDERDPKIAEFFEKIAPLNNTDKIKKPLFIVQGGNDPRVPYTESVQMKEKITQNGGTVWFLMAKDEGHGFRKKPNQDFEFYSVIEFINRFLINEPEKTKAGN
jgi:dipeptidyl aminopeptidase/acylaminoacyl peptidase